MRLIPKASFALIPILGLLLFSAAPAFARNPGRYGYAAAFAGSYTLPDGSQWLVGVALSGDTASSLSGFGLVCQVDPGTLVCKDPGPNGFQATGALTIDSTTGTASLLWVVKDPGPGSLPGGTTSQCGGTVTSFGGGSSCGTGTQFTLTFPTGVSATGNTIFFAFRNPGPLGP